MIFGAHVIVYSKDATADRVFLREVLGLSSVDAGHGWLIFALPPAEVAVHPAERMTGTKCISCVDDLKAEIAALGKKGVHCSEVHEERWGSITKIRLPGGGDIGLYQPKHPTAFALTSRSEGRRSMIIEMRTYKIKPGCRARFLEIFRTKSIPAHAEIGMKIIRPISFGRRSRHLLFHARFSRLGFARADESAVL